jgi:hypothetical protein
MTTSAPLSLTSVISRADEKLAPGQLGYLHAYAQDRAHDLVRELFMAESRADANLTRAFLARRLGKKPEQITRWLAVPGNWTLGTLAELLAAMGYAPTFGAEKIGATKSNRHHPLIGQRPLPNPIPRVEIKVTTGSRDQNVEMASV